MKKSFNFYRWSIWSIFAASFVLVFFHRLGFGVVSQDVGRDIGLGSFAISNIASVTFYSYAAMQIPEGILVDRFGPRILCSIGMFLSGIGAILFSVSKAYLWAFLGRLLVGVGTSGIFISILKFQTFWFTTEEFSMASGLMSFIGNLGAVCAMYPLSIGVKYEGWRKIFFVIGFISILFAIIIYLFVKDKPSLLGYEDKAVTIKNRISLREGLKNVLTKRGVYADLFVMFSLISCTTALTGLWGIPYLMGVYEINREKAAFYLSFLTIGFMIGSVVMGRAVKWFKNDCKNIIRVSSSVILILWIYILLINNGKPPLYMMPIIFLIMGILVLSHILTFTNINQIIDNRYAGLAMSIINVGEFAGSTFISLVIGYMMDKNKASLSLGFRNAFYIFIFMSIMSIVASSFMENGEKLKNVD